MTLVSVIIPAFNAQNTLERAATSVLGQTHDRIEVIIIDDGSTDDTARIAAAIAARDSRCTLIGHDTNSGAAAARNTGIDGANGDYVAFLDADDAWHPDKLQRQLTAMAQRGGGICYTGFTRILGSGRGREVIVPHQVDYNTLLRGNVICCSSVIVHRSALAEARFPPYRRRQDFALWLDLLRGGQSAIGIGDPLVDHYVTQGSLSSRPFASMAATYRVYRHHVGMGAPRAVALLGRHLMARLRRG